MNPLYLVYRWIVFTIGDTRWIGWKFFPFIITWDVKEPEVDGYELEAVRKILQPGDVLLLRHDGFLSNVGIGGALVHMALYVGEGECIEALSDDQGGVCKRHVLNTMSVDKALVLRPVLPAYALAKAMVRAFNILGFKYDIFFQFNSEEEREAIVDHYDKAKAGQVKFCCTEIFDYCYAEYRKHFGIEQRKNVTLGTKILSILGLKVGDRIVTADQIAEARNLDIIWASKHCTPAWFKSMGSSELLIRKLELFLASKGGTA